MDKQQVYIRAQTAMNDFDVFPWIGNFKIGHEEIDRQHKKLFSLINELARSLIQGESVDLRRAFDELVQYANFHFKYEESVWAEFLDEVDLWFSDHNSKHESFLLSVSALQNNAKGKPVIEVLEDILQFLIGWFVYHIIDDDKRLVIAIKAMSHGHTIEQAKAIADKEMNGSVLELFEAGMQMYRTSSSQSLSLIRERKARAKVEAELREANDQLAELAITDQLTGLFNRRHFDNVIKAELQRAHRDQKSLALISFDIDYFKKLNDHYGHSVGDEALKKIGQRLKEICRRSSDFSFRLGGEEFAVITTDQTNQDGMEYGERIRKHIEELKIPNINSKASDYMTVSVGLVIANPETGYDSDKLMKIVDQRLYAAKDLGRNRIVAS
ncbi:GGDEF domain-containing protein [Amphritea sp. HPY]|uniref:GGDEF domain-containing protein n=1 Tax=Amphritea sp. HPY TaxID=3421652 RepID=UPI003D7C3F3F